MSAPAETPGTPRVSAIVVSFNTRDELQQCLASLVAQTPPVEIVVVDNASSDGSVAAVRSFFPDAVVIANETNVGFARACNIGLQAARGQEVLFLNSDCELRPGTLAVLAEILDRRPEVAMVGPRHVGGGGHAQVSFGPALTPMAEWRQGRLVRGVQAQQREAMREAALLSSREHEPDWLSASCLLVRRAALDAVGGFDESFFLYEEDVDLCVRVRQMGGRIVFTPATDVIHHLGRSMAKAPERARLEYHRSHLRYYAKHNPLGQRLALRAWLAGKGLWSWVRAGSGVAGRARRAEAAEVVRIAFFG